MCFWTRTKWRSDWFIFGTPGKKPVLWVKKAPGTPLALNFCCSGGLKWHFGVLVIRHLLAATLKAGLSLFSLKTQPAVWKFRPWLQQIKLKCNQSVSANQSPCHRFILRMDNKTRKMGKLFFHKAGRNMQRIHQERFDDELLMIVKYQRSD